jgi:excinuclease ABC subunit B
MQAGFKIQTKFEATGDQPSAIRSITARFEANDKHHVLLGVTGSGKTFTMANVIQNLGKPTLVMAPNKTLAAQLFTELREFFPENAVEFFISYYDYYQPEAYVPSTDTYIAKDSAINDDIDKMRHSATRSLFERRDVIIVASVSCIYGLGSPQSYAKLMFTVQRGMSLRRDKLLRQLVDIQYTRNDKDLQRGNFRVRGDTVDILPAHQKNEAIRIEFFGDEIESIELIDALSGKTLRKVDELSLYPNSHYVSDRNDAKQIIREILEDLGVRLREFKALGKMLEYQRLEQRVMNDVEMFEHLGYCQGIENYSRYLTGLPPGHPPPTLLDYFPKDFLIILDESHITLPQIRGMYRGDRARKEVLVNYGFRLPSALDNRPLNFDEFLGRSHQILHVSATPGPYELTETSAAISEQIIRPTGLLDPVIEIRPVSGQVDDLYNEMKQVISAGGRILITTLTKKMAEDLSQYYIDRGIKVRYLHADIESLERVEIIRDLRKGVIDVIIGINLLREGLDIPEVRLVAVMDADKEGFLRSRSSLIQISGRAARNSTSRVFFYADRVTDSMKACIDETTRRRQIQTAYNTAHGITPTTISKDMSLSLREIYGLSNGDGIQTADADSFDPASIMKSYNINTTAQLDKLIRTKTKRMQKLAGELEFEKAAELRDEIGKLKAVMISLATTETETSS